MQALLLFLFCWLLPSQLGRHFFFPFSYITGVRVDYLAPTLYLSDILALILIAVNWRLFIPLWHRKKLLAAIAAALLFNFFFALSKPLFFYGSAKAVEAAAVFYIFARRYREYKRPIVMGLALAALTQFPLVIAQLTLRHSLQGIWYFLGERLFSLSTPGIAKASLDGRELLRPYGTFSHPNSLAGFFLLVELFFLMNKDITNAVLKYAVIFCASFMVLFSFSKNAILAYLLVNLIYLSKTKGCRLCLIASTLTSLVLAAVFFQAHTDPLSFDKRFTLIGQSLSIILRHPLGGVGLGNYLLATAAFPIRYSYFFLQPVHNIFLLLAAQTGLPLFLLLGYIILRFYRCPLPLPFLLLSLAVFLTGMIDHYWLTLQQNLLVAAALSGAFLYNNEHGTKKTARRD